MQLVQNVIIVTLCVDSRHTFFITFCVNGIRSVSNDKHFVACYDRWHNYSIVLIFDELLIFFFYQYCRWISPVCYPPTKSEGYILRRPCIRPSTPSVHSVHPSALLSVRNPISVLTCHIRIILCTNDMYHVLSISYKFRQNRPLSEL